MIDTRKVVEKRTWMNKKINFVIIYNFLIKVSLVELFDINKLENITLITVYMGITKKIS